MKKILLCDAFFSVFTENITSDSAWFFYYKSTIVLLMPLQTLKMFFTGSGGPCTNFMDHPNDPLCVYICIYVVLSFEDTIVVASVALPSHTPIVPLLYFHICFPAVHNRTLLLGRVRDPTNLTCFLPVCSVICMCSPTLVQHVFMTNF